MAGDTSIGVGGTIVNPTATALLGDGDIVTLDANVERVYLPP